MYKLIFLLAFIPLLSFSIDPGDRTGNGGDFVRTSFIVEGHRILRLLSDTREGQEFCEDHGLSLEVLNLALKTSVIEVTSDRLFDQYGNEVDALGEKSKITLNKARWEKLFASELDLRAIIFHEILRAADINDDDYVISNHLPLAAMPDLYLALKKELRKLKAPANQEIKKYFYHPGRQNQIWRCEFANQDSSSVFKGQALMHMKSGFHLSIINNLTQMKLVTDMSLYNKKAKYIRIPGFDFKQNIKFEIKFDTSKNLLFNFDEAVYGRCHLL